MVLRFIFNDDSIFMLRADARKVRVSTGFAMQEKKPPRPDCD